MFTLTYPEYQAYLNQPNLSGVRQMLNSAANDYIATRCCTLNHLRYPVSGAMAIEKYLKAYIYLKTGQGESLKKCIRSNYKRFEIDSDKGQGTKGLKTDLHHLPSLMKVAKALGFRQIPYFDEIAEDYLAYYLNRYPDNFERIADTSGHVTIKGDHLYKLDLIIWELHWAMQRIVTPELLYHSGINWLIFDYLTESKEFKPIVSNQVKWLLQENKNYTSKRLHVITNKIFRLIAHWKIPIYKDASDIFTE